MHSSLSFEIVTNQVWLDDVSFDQLHECQVPTFKKINPKFVSLWNKMLIDIFDYFNQATRFHHSQDVVPGENDVFILRIVKLIYILAECLFHAPMRRLSGEVQYENLLSQTKTLKKRFRAFCEEGTLANEVPPEPY